MSTGYDFRKVLNVRPVEGTCIGTVKMGRCSHMLSLAIRITAENILDEINKKQTASLQNIEDLADLMLCKEQHNNDARPHLSQVDEMCVKWETRIEEHERALKLEMAKKSVMNSMKELHTLQKNIESVTTGKKEHKRKVCDPRNSPTTSTNM